jgi:ADP-heptose:LPS heptosyltransferase
MTSLDDLYMVLERIDLLITIDTGTRHIANAVGTNAIILRNGANSILEFAAYVETEKEIAHPVPCSPCGCHTCPLGTLDCMTRIAIEDVLSEIKII